MIVKTLIFLAMSLTIYLAIAAGLILSQPVPQTLPEKGGLDFSGQLALEATPLEAKPVAMRDGYPLMTRHLLAGTKPAPLVVMVHGSGWHGGQFDRLAARLSDVAEVVVPDLRGHGAAPGTRGDIAYIGQLEDDLADLITAHRMGNQKVILLGHSSGGGLVTRFAGGPHGDMIAGAVLLAPFLKYNAPTTREASGGWAQPLTRRIIGLSMLNRIGIHALDHLQVIRFAMPQAVLDGPMGHTATTGYSWRLNTSYAPRSAYLTDVAVLPRFLLLVGSEDESFVAEAYEPLMSAETDRGTYQIIDGVSHLDVVNAAATETAIREFLDALD